VTNIVAGNRIATYTDEDGVSFDVNETVTSLVDNNDGTFTFTHEDGVATTISAMSLETLTSLTNTIAGNRIGTYTDEDGMSFDVDETVTELVANGNGTFTFTHEGGTTTTIDVGALETLTLVTNTIAGNRIATYTDENGVTFDVNETVTVLNNNNNGTFTFTHEDGTQTTITGADLETLTTLTNTIAGNRIGTYTGEDGLAFDVNETVTSLVDNNDGSFTFTHEGGAVTTLDVGDMETLTSVTNTVAGNRIATYINEDGITFDVNETVTALVDNGDGTFTFTHEDGLDTVISAASIETLTTVTNTVAGNRIATYTDEDGVTFDVNESVTTLVDNGDGTFTFIGEDGIPSTLSVAALETLTTVTNLLTVGNRIGTYTDEDGNTFDLNESISDLADNNNGTFTYTNELGVPTTIDIGDLETLTSITNVLAFGNPIATYTDEAGGTVDLKESITALVDNGDGTFTFTHEGGTTSTLDAGSLETLTTVSNVIASGHLIGTYTDEDGNTVDLNETVTALVDNGDGTLTFTDEAGVPTLITIANLETLTSLTNVLAAGNRIGSYTDEAGLTVDINETVTALVDNGDGTLSFTHEDGSISTLTIANLETLTTITNAIVGNRIASYTDEDGVTFDINETITSLVDNGNGTFTFTSENGTVTTIDFGDTLAGLNCVAGDFVMFDGTNWVCVIPTSTDDQILKISGGTIFIEDGNDVSFPIRTIYEETYAGGTDDGFGQAWGRNLRMRRVAIGVWDVGFAFPHPDGTNYAVSVLTEEQSNLRDSVLPWVTQGSKSAFGFQISLATGDNGLAADLYVDTPFTVSVDAPVDLLEPAP